MTCLGMSARSATPAAVSGDRAKAEQILQRLGRVGEAALCLTREPGGGLFRTRRKGASFGLAGESVRRPRSYFLVDQWRSAL